MPEAPPAKISADSWAHQLRTSLGTRTGQLAPTADGPADPRSFVDWAYRTVVGRPPDPPETTSLLQELERGLPRPIAMARLASSDEALRNVAEATPVQSDRTYRELQLALHFSGVPFEPEAFAWVLAAHEVLTGAPETITFLANYQEFLEQRSMRGLIRKIVLERGAGAGGIRRRMVTALRSWSAKGPFSAERRIRAVLPLYRVSLRLHNHMDLLEHRLSHLEAADHPEAGS